MKAAIIMQNMYMYSIKLVYKSVRGLIEGWKGGGAIVVELSQQFLDRKKESLVLNK